MKPASSALVSYLAALRSAPDPQILKADLFTFVLSSGAVLRYTDLDVAVVANGATFVANSVQVSGLKYKASRDLQVDQQQIQMIAGPEDLISGSPLLVALRNKVFDGAKLTRERAFFSDFLGGTVIGTVTLFVGLLTSIDKIGLRSATATVKSLVTLLDIQMPRNLYQPTCLHRLYDAGCSLRKTDFSVSGTVGAASTSTRINWTGADAIYEQGTITFTSGAAAGASANVKTIAPGVSATLSYPLVSAPATGDAFTISRGCAHSMVACQSFDNIINFRAFPFVPPPETAF